MGIIKLAFVSLKKDMSKSIFYFLTFLLTTIFIFSFFNLTFNPYSGIHLGKDDTTFVTPIAVFVIVIAMLCVFLANNFYVSNKGKEISIILMSGASIYQLGFYLFLQVFIIMLCAIPLGLILIESHQSHVNLQEKRWILDMDRCIIEPDELTV